MLRSKSALVRDLVTEIAPPKERLFAGEDDDDE